MSWDWLKKAIRWPETVFRSNVTHGVRPPLEPQDKDPLSVQFCHEVNNATALLDFLITEGHPYRVPDQIIEKIETARTLVRQPGVPPAEERAKLLEAYRDLVAIPGTSVLFDFPPTPFWKSPWRRILFVFALLLPIIFLLISLFYSPWQAYWCYAVGFGLVSGLLIWALYAFTGIVTNHKLNHIIAFCYLFTGVVLVLSILPWWMPTLFSGESRGAPAGFVRACALDAPDDSDVSCSDDGDQYQWVLNIGGVTIKSDTATQNATQEAGVQVYSIRGGLVVPLFVIILSLIGGAVSMTRRVPEYQRRAMSSQDPLTNQQARESFVFQIMQVASAPLIAVAAYYIVNPTSMITSVVLGFGSGFASEPILLMIRGLVEKLSPGGAPKPSGVSVRVEPASKELKPGESQQFTAHVSGAASPDVTWFIVPPDVGWITPNGYYTAPKEEGKTATITASSVADKTKTGSASVTVTSKPAAAQDEPAPAPADDGGDEGKS
jgi:hypothetical protein